MRLAAHPILFSVIAPILTGLSLSSTAAPLTANDVLRSAARYFPSVLEAEAKRDALEGERLATLGAFDTQLLGSGFNRIAGFYDGARFSGGLKRQLRGYGSQVYSSYSLSDGTLPIYEDQFFTNEAGELKLGVLLSLLRDSSIDELRFAERDSQLALTEANIELLLTRIEVQQRALIAFWQWVRLGYALKAYQNLLTIAEERQAALQTEVEQGRRARIYLVENQMNMTQRRSLVTTFTRDFDIASVRLGMFLRNAEGAPYSPSWDQLPPLANTTPLDTYPSAANITGIVERRPEIQILKTAMQRTEQRLALAENNLRPRLDFNMELAQPLGALGEGGVSRDEPQAIVGFNFSIPLENRRAKGKMASAKSKLRALEAEQQRTRDALAIELRTLVTSLSAAKKLEQLALVEVAQTDELRRAEFRRFDNGASDFFLLNLRETAAANAEIKLVAARADLAVARARYDAATLNLSRLHLTDPH